MDCVNVKKWKEKFYLFTAWKVIAEVAYCFLSHHLLYGKFSLLFFSSRNISQEPLNTNHSLSVCSSLHQFCTPLKINYAQMILIWLWPAFLSSTSNLGMNRTLSRIRLNPSVSRGPDVDQIAWSTQSISFIVFLCLNYYFFFIYWFWHWFISIFIFHFLFPCFCDTAIGFFHFFFLNENVPFPRLFIYFILMEGFY